MIPFLDTTLTEELMAYGDKHKRYYFAYAINMYENQMRIHCAAPEVITVAELKGYSLGFYGYSRVWDGALAAVTPAEGQSVWGVVYAMSYRAGYSLDAWFDIRLDGGGAYFHYPVRVTDQTGKSHALLLYKKDVLGAPGTPGEGYLDCLIRGAVNHGLPSTYIDKLRNTPCKKERYPVPLSAPSLRVLTEEAHCETCAG